jgi:hypothetical protein
VARTISEVGAYTLSPIYDELVRWIDGRLCVWDADPDMLIWIPVRIWCRNGPLDEVSTPIMVCSRCRPRPF